MLLGAFRFLMAGTLMLSWSLFRGEKIFNKKDILHSAISGTLMLFVGTGVVIWVEQVLPSALVAILVSGAPFWFILLDKRAWSVSFRSKSTIAGLIIGFIGIILLFWEKMNGLYNGTGVQSEIGSMFLILIGSLSWTFGSIFSKYNPSSGSNTVNAGWQMFAAGIPFTIGSLITGETADFSWSNVSTEAWLSIWYLILFGSIAAYTAYIWLLQVRPSTQVSTYAYVNPVVAVLLGVAFASEKISLLQISGLAIILGSVLLINLAKYRLIKKYL